VPRLLHHAPNVTAEIVRVELPPRRRPWRGVGSDPRRHAAPPPPNNDVSDAANPPLGVARLGGGRAGRTATRGSAVGSVGAVAASPAPPRRRHAIHDSGGSVPPPPLA